MSASFLAFLSFYFSLLCIHLCIKSSCGGALKRLRGAEALDIIKAEQNGALHELLHQFLTRLQRGKEAHCSHHTVGK